MTTRIEQIRAITTAPAGVRLVVVKLETTDAGLYGLGCATFTQRHLAVVEAVESYLDPLLKGQDVNEIEDIYQTCYLSSYWRGGPVLNNALSGVDMALWDIKGKLASMPVHDLLGGKCRQAATVYMHANGATVPEAIESAIRLREEGLQHIRMQVQVPGQATYGTKSDLQTSSSVNSPSTPQNIFEPADYVRLAPQLFERAREALGTDVELLHDVHERVPAPLAIELAKALEPFRLFFLEDPFAPEDIGYFRQLRNATHTPIAMGELFTDVNQYLPLVQERLIDFIRLHLSFVGGLSMGRKIATLCEFFGVRTAWHGPPDTSPIGHAANLALDLSVTNFGVQEFSAYNQAMQDVFPGCNELRDCCLWPNDQPGWGIDLDEELAGQFPLPDHPYNGAWPPVRRRDGGIIRP